MNSSQTRAPFSKISRRIGTGAFVLTWFAVAGVAAAAVPAVPSAVDILEEALQRHEARLADVQDVTIELQLMGISSTAFLVTEEIDGRRVLVPRAQNVSGLSVDAVELGDLWTDPLAFYGDSLDRWQLHGAGSIDGRQTWRLSLSDFSGLDLQLGLETLAEDVQWEPQRIDMELDQSWLVPLLLAVEGEILESGQRRPLSVIVRFSDYREIDGFLHPFLTVLETDVVASGLSDEEIAEIRLAIQEFQREIEDAPEEYRAIMELFLGNQIAELERALAGDGLRIEIRVNRLQINAATVTP